MISGNWSSGAVKITAIGSIWAMSHDAGLRRGVDDIADIDLPSPTVPEIGALTVA